MDPSDGMRRILRIEVKRRAVHSHGQGLVLAFTENKCEQAGLRVLLGNERKQFWMANESRTRGVHAHRNRAN